MPIRASTSTGGASKLKVGYVVRAAIELIDANL
jgi:hypothetical protein